MNDLIIKVENLGKQYRLGKVGTGNISHDLNRWWHKVRGKEDPYLKVGEKNDRTQKGGSEYVWSLRDMSFDVRQGEVLGIIGKNGAGKSTLLKILSRITSPTTGSFKVRGRIASLLEVGTGFHPDLSGRENIFLNGAILGMTKQEIISKFDEIVDFSGVEKYIDTPVKRYSSGMYVRLAFAVAAHLEPEILIIDEVLSVGDQEFQNKCLGKMKSVSTAGRTVLFVSHNLPAVKSLCTRSILLDKGEKRFDGDTSDAIAEYMSMDHEEIYDGIIPRNYKQRMGTGECRFTMVRLINSLSEKCTQLYFRESFRVLFTIEADKDVKNLVFWIRFFDPEGTEVLVSESSKNVFDFEELSTGTHTYEVEVGEHLMPGDYYISLGAYMNGMAVDYPEKCLYFKVFNTARSSDEHYRWQKSYGYVFSNSNWKKIN
ncbi:MAG: ABC transporter ATP-binding protein [Bacteroidia bacterium]|nr:ABC transporter ATP-binding protein [Bacteroidia bacterium]